MKLWIDDERVPPDGWVWAKTYEDAMDYINNHPVTHISFDHDLGQRKTGYDIAKHIEEMAVRGLMPQIDWSVHSANPVGRRNIHAAMTNADRAWAKNKES